MQLSWCLEEKLARSTSFWRHKRSVREHINPAIWDIIAIWDSVLKAVQNTQAQGKAGWGGEVNPALDQKAHVHMFTC